MKDQVQKELEIIKKRSKGILRPVDVVNFAKNPKTALHSKFTWDDTAAAQQYRLWQAREVIRITVTLLPNDNKPVRAYVSLSSDRAKTDGGYRGIVEVLSDEYRNNELLREAKRDMQRFATKYRHLVKLSKVIEEMQNVLEEKVLA
jgi:hypothetical protein